MKNNFSFLISNFSLKKRCVIVGGAEIKNYDLIRKYFKPEDFFIYCDCGLKHEKFLAKFAAIALESVQPVP